MFGKTVRLNPNMSSLYRNTVIDADSRVFGVPGASLYHANLDNANGQLNAGILGEQKVAEVLEQYAATHENTYVFHSVKLPGEVGDIDHLVVRGDKAVLVDTKNWRSHASYILGAADNEAEYVYRDGEMFEGGTVHLNRQLHDWAAVLPQFQVMGVLTLANRTASVSTTVDVFYEFMNLSGLEGFLEHVLPGPVNPLPYESLVWFAHLVQDPNFDPANHLTQEMVPAFRPTIRKEPTAEQIAAQKNVGWLVLWSVMNYVVGFFLLPFIGLSVIPLIVVAHRKHVRIQMAEGRTTAVVLTLVFSYMLVTVWFFLWMLLLFGFFLQQAL